MEFTSADAWSQIGNIVLTSGVSFQPGLPTAGSLGTIFCTGLTVDGAASATGLPLPYNLAGVTVTIGEAPAPLFSVANLGTFPQINFQVPYEASPNPDTTMQVVLSQNWGPGGNNG